MSNGRFALIVLSAFFSHFGLSERGFAIDRNVANTAEFAAALAAAQPGDNILLAPGIYSGGHFRAGLNDVTIRGTNPSNPPVIRGGTTGLQLSDATAVTLQHLIFEQQTGNGVNIDDGGSFATPTTDLVIRDVVVRDMNASGNNDGIKISGVTGFLIENVVVDDWGNGGSAIDPVGSHNGLIQNSLFRHTTAGSSGVRPKGGSKNITIRANRFEMAAAGRAIQAGGSTGAAFFRFIDGDSGYEAANIIAEGNVLIGASAATSFANIDGGIFHHNRIERPDDWAVRILNENQGNSIVDTQNGRFEGNVVVFNDTPSEWNRAVNIGRETLPETYQFSGNQWYNLADPTVGGSTPQLPVQEIGGTYGVAPDFTINEPIVWDFAWGKWIVNANEQPSSISTAGFDGLRMAEQGTESQFDPLLASPLSGNWTLADLPPTIQLAAFSQAILLNPDNFQSAVPGDFDGNGIVDQNDYSLWRSQFGLTGIRAADANRDGVVNGADYTVWRDNLGAGSASLQSAVMVSEPGASALIAVVVMHLQVLRRFRRMKHD